MVKRATPRTIEPETLHRDLAAAREGIRELTEPLSEAQLVWSPEAGMWSVADCLEHLVVTGESYLEAMEAAAEKARRRGWSGDGVARLRWWERAFVAQMEPPPGWRMPAPKVFVPSAGSPQSVGRLLALQDRLEDLLHRCRDLDLSRARLRSPALALMRLRLGSTFALGTAHQRRHLWQARRLTQHPQFPGIG